MMISFGFIFFQSNTHSNNENKTERIVGNPHLVHAGRLCTTHGYKGGGAHVLRRKYAIYRG